MEVEDINAWLTRMDAERLLAQLQKRPYSEPSLVPPHAQARQLEVRLGWRQEAAACGGSVQALSAHAPWY